MPLTFVDPPPFLAPSFPFISKIEPQSFAEGKEAYTSDLCHHKLRKKKKFPIFINFLFVGIFSIFKFFLFPPTHYLLNFFSNLLFSSFRVFFSYQSQIKKIKFVIFGK
jgi:hypothetical protein